MTLRVTIISYTLKLLSTTNCQNPQDIQKTKNLLPLQKFQTYKIYKNACQNPLDIQNNLYMLWVSTKPLNYTSSVILLSLLSFMKSKPIISYPYLT